MFNSGSSNGLMNQKNGVKISSACSCSWSFFLAFFGGCFIDCLELQVLHN